jgi:hypothetical protein
MICDLAAHPAHCGAAAADPANAHLAFIRLASRGDVNRFLAGPLHPGLTRS